GQMNGNNNGHQQPQTSKAEEKLLDYLTSNERDAKERYDKLLEQVSTKGSAGMDPMALMMLLERSKPQPLPWKEMMAELKANQPSPFESKLDKSLSGLDALMMAPAPEKKDHATEALGRIVESLIAAQVKTAATPAPAAVVPVQDPLMGQILTALIAKAFAVPTGPTALEAKLDKIIEINLTPQKSKGMSELGGDMVAMIELMKKLRPEEEPPPHPLVETIGLIAENADKLGDALAKIMTSRQAPQLPAGNGATEATGTQLPKPPDAAVAGLKTMAEATTDQGIINGLDGTLKALATGPEAYQRFAKAVVGAYIEADSLPAIRSVVTQLFIKCGQKDIATEPVIEKVTKSLTAHYSFLHKTLTGREKTLPVTEAKPPPVTVTEVKPEVKPEGAKVIDFVKPAQVEATKEPVKEAAKEAITMPAPTKVSDPMAALMNTVGAAERSEEEEEEEEEEEDDEGPLTETDFDEMWADMSSEERVLFLKKAQKMAGS
ncbi:MAG: hypothetical protein Q7R39_11475, partial [Dehalococcoidia bacterium]|nr:hypothetical protein [Dehalococcoidia bacterium]